MVWFIFLVSQLVLITYTILLPVSAIQESINITQGKSISVGQTIVSSGGNFVLGFFSPGNSTNSYLGIWYNTIDIPKQTVIWVANRESPIPKNSNSTAVFTLGRDGNLAVLSGIMGEVIWSSDVRVDDSYVNSTVGVLLETGNLVLRRSGSEEIELWQSFDHPTDTLMPGMKLGWRKYGDRKAIATSWADDDDPKPGMFNVGFNPQGRLQIHIWKQHDPYWRSNVFNQYEPLVTFNGSLEPAPFVTFSEEGDDMYIHFDVLDKSIKLRATLTPKGQGQVLVWAASKWFAIADLPRTKCDFYGACGPFASCEQDSSPASCSCLPGYKPYSQIDWDMGNRSGGCVSTESSCNMEDTFQMIERVKLPDFSLSLGNMSAQECQLTCLRNCTCTAYAYFVGETTVNCFNWFRDLVDLVHNDFLGRDIYVRIRVSKEVDNVGTGHSTFIKRNSTTIAATTVSFGLLLITISSYVLWRKKFRNKGRIEGNMQGITDGVKQRDTELVSFSFQSILAATDNFSEANKLGEGGFGPVYKGSLPEFPRVAVKRLSKKSLQGNEEFINELKLIAKLQHKNLVRILGCCLEGDEKILIYEYMPNRSLDTFIFNPSEQTNLDWNNRFRIIEGITQGLLYLHKYSRLKVIHRDMKASNVLLDEAMNPKISDFGMARIVNINQIEANTNRVVGTYGYMSPEYALYGKFSEKSDVFSFGVLLLEIVSGRKNTGFYNTTFLTLLEWVWENWEVGKGEDLIDPSIRESCTIQEVLKCINVGLLCVQEVPSDRPSMSRVAFMLSNEIASLPSPKQPGFSTQRRIPNTIGPSSQTSNKFSNNEVTISMLEAR